MPPLKAQLLLEESLSAYFPEMVFTDSGITVQLHRNTQQCYPVATWDVRERRPYIPTVNEERHALPSDGHFTPPIYFQNGGSQRPPPG
ncbi:hypothetical protein KAM344_36510 [Aeromonas caviae]|nr:hypothetical protein KAM344_36510 [Aeromonas caviae]